MTDREKAVVMAYTGYTMLIGDKLDIFYKYAREKLGQCVMTHELAYPEVLDKIKEAAKEDFIEIAKADNGWVSVKDRMPDENEEVILFYEWTGRFSGNKYREVGFGTIAELGQEYFVIAWMPLPEPPKEEMENDLRRDQKDNK